VLIKVDKNGRKNTLGGRATSATYLEPPLERLINF
jgi:hypothetical protein